MMYYPKGYNPIHEVMSWSKVRSMVRAIESGIDVPPFLVDGENLLSGTHRAVANELLERRSRTTRRIETIEFDDLAEQERARVLDAVDCGHWDEIEY